MNIGKINFQVGNLHGIYKEVMIMSGLHAKIAVLLTLLGIIAAGCASSQTGKTAKRYDENFRFVPRVHVEENSFGVTSGSEFRGCSYDIYYEGYWCPVR